MLVAGRELEEAVVGLVVRQRVADVDVGVADVGGHDREADQAAQAGVTPPSMTLQKLGVELLVADDPLALHDVGADDHVGLGRRGSRGHAPERQSTQSETDGGLEMFRHSSLLQRSPDPCLGWGKDTLLVQQDSL